ncbi:hypothetical protein T06_12674 [Trichinella sp. T6]|nr:hypothetical protein T06_12674 [Trichinella sp. T6]
MQYRIVTRISFLNSLQIVELLNFCSGIPTGAAAYYHDVYAAQEKNLHNNAILRSNMNTSDAEEEEELATPSAARLFLYSYVQRNLFDVQDNTTQYLEELLVACALYELRIAFDYCSLHVSTVISYVSQQFRFLHRHSFPEWIEKMYKNL